MRPLCRTAAGVAVVLAGLLALTGCEWEGLTGLPLPGNPGGGENAYQVQIQMPDVTNLTENSRVRVGDVNVGTVTEIEAARTHAVVTVSLEPDVVLPGNATAKIGQTSLLGSKHLELAQPMTEPPAGRLSDGDTIPLSRAGKYPTTEETLASLSLVLNGSGLGQIKTITSELNAALSGREDAVRSLLGRLRTLLGGLDQQKADIIAAIEGLNRLSARLGKQTQILADAIETLPPALAVLNRERTDLVEALTALGELGDVATRVVNSAREDLLANLRNLEPVLRELADAGRALPQSLLLAASPPFPIRTLPNACRGDFCNLFATVDLTLPTLDKAWLSGTPLQGRLAGLEGLLDEFAGIAGHAADPLRGPVTLPKPGDAPTLPGPLTGGPR